jgi:hypothetical protein
LRELFASHSQGQGQIGQMAVFLRAVVAAARLDVQVLLDG